MNYNQGGGFYQPQQHNPNFNSTPYPQGNTLHSVEQGAPKHEFNFNDRTIRVAFVRKVFFIVSIMLGIVTAMITVAVKVDGVKATLRNNFSLQVAALATMVVILVVLVCCSSVRYTFPINIICLTIFTLSVGYTLMVATSRYDTDTVFLVSCLTFSFTTLITLFACQTKFDITKYSSFFCIGGLVLFFFGLFVTFFSTHGSTMRYIYSGLTAILFMGYLAFDIQMMIGGKKLEISPEDYILASINIFLDIITLFLTLLSLVGGKGSD